MKNTKTLALCLFALLSAPCLAQTVECETSRGDIADGALATKIRVEFDHDKFSRTLSATVYSKDQKEFYKKGRAHSGGGSYTTINDREVRYYGRDYCLDYTYKTQREGPFWNRQTIVTGFSCDISSRDITIMEIYPQDRSHNEPSMYIESVKVMDFESELLGDGWVEFNNCVEL